MTLLDVSSLDVDRLSKTVENLQEAEAALPAAEQEAYRAAQQSVVDARRKAETHEGLLRVC